jgi:hypothetical protein
MKVKLLKKIRARYTMTYNPNTEIYVMKFKYKWHWWGDWEIDSTTYKTKGKMFEVYRKSVISWCGHSYGCYKQPKRQKPIETIKHCK